MVHVHISIIYSMSHKHIRAIVSFFGNNTNGTYENTIKQQEESANDDAVDRDTKIFNSNA